MLVQTWFVPTLVYLVGLDCGFIIYIRHSSSRQLLLRYIVTRETHSFCPLLLLLQIVDNELLLKQSRGLS